MDAGSPGLGKITWGVSVGREEVAPVLVPRLEGRGEAAKESRTEWPVRKESYQLGQVLLTGDQMRTPRGHCAIEKSSNQQKERSGWTGPALAVPWPGIFFWQSLCTPLAMCSLVASGHWLNCPLGKSMMVGVVLG